jgi:hypothetical protein
LLFLAGRELEARAASISILSPLDDLDGASLAQLGVQRRRAKPSSVHARTAMVSTPAAAMR